MNLLAELAAQSPLLLTATPLFGAALAWFSARRSFAAARQSAIINTSLTLFVAGAMAWNFVSIQDSLAGQMMSVARWWRWPLTDASGPLLQFDIALGVDGLSLMPLLAVALIGWVVALTADRCCADWQSDSYAGVLLGQSLAMTAFASQDFLTFLLSCELWAWWAFFAIGRAGGTGRKSAAGLFLISSRLAHALCGLGAIGLVVSAAWIQFELRGRPADLSLRYAHIVWTLARWVKGNETALEVWTNFQPWVLSCWLFGLWLRWPIFPAHRWWSGLWTEARAPIAAFCGATLMLQGGYVFLRFVAPFFPSGTIWGWLLIDAATLGTLYFGLLAFSQTEWRKLACYSSLAVSHAALLGLISGHPQIALAGWQMLLMASLSVAALALVIGWRERRASVASDATGELGFSPLSPGGRGWLALSAGILGLLPAFAGITGLATLSLWELAQHGVPNLMLLSGALLTGWGILRGMLNSLREDYSVEQTRALFSVRENAIGLLIVAALCLGAALALWQPVVQPTVERLFDPFAQPMSSATVREPPSASTVLKTELLDEVHSPPVELWLRAPLLWAVGGACLLFLPRGWLTPRWETVIAIVSLLGGLLMDATGARPTSDPSWVRAVLWSASLFGLVQFTIFSSAASNRGASLLRLSAIGWAALTGDLLIAGLAWELGEVARRLGQTNDAPQSSHLSRELMRHLISSACFWIGVACCLGLWSGTTHFAELSASITKAVPRDADAQVLEMPTRWGLATVLLLISAVGVRCGLVPWSLGPRRDASGGSIGDRAVDQCLNQLLGLTMLLHFVPVFGVGYGGPLCVVCAVAAVGTGLWSGLRVMAASTVNQLLQALMTNALAGQVLLLAAVAVLSFLVADSGHVRQWDRRPLLNLLAMSCLSMSLAVAGMVAILRRLGEPAYGELFLEQYQGVLSRRFGTTCVLIGFLIGLIGCWPLAGFWPAWLGALGELMTLIPAEQEPAQTHPVLLAAVIFFTISSWLHGKRVVEWIRCLTLDPPVAVPPGSGRPWDLIAAVALLAISLLLGCWPALWLRIL